MKTKSAPRYQYIIFDLDNTLYPKEAGLMDAVSERILAYMIHHVAIPPDDAPLKKLSYYQEFGTALRGLMHEYSDFDPVDFLEYVHNIRPELFFKSSPPLDRMLHNIPLRKIIFTNSCLPHCWRVLEVLQVKNHFEQIFDVEAMGFRCKPDPLVYERLLDSLNVSGQSCIMVDDSPRNLIPAKNLGMTTILVDGSRHSLAVDYAVPTVFHVENILRELLPDSLLY